MKKKTTLILLLFFSTLLIAQPYNQQDIISRVNSSTTALDSAGVFTGTAEDVLYQSSITTYIKSNVNGTFLMQFSSNGTNWDIKIPFTYTATDTTTTYYLPVIARYFRIVYTNGTTAQTSFRLQTIYHKGMILPIENNMVKVKVGSSTLPTGATTASNQTAQLNELKGAVKYYGAIATVNTTDVDTLTFTASYWLEGKITASDSIEVAINGSFTAGQTFIITNTNETTLPKWDATISDKLYIRRYGTAGSPVYNYKISAK